MEDYDAIIDTPYSCSKDPSKTEDTRRTMMNANRVIENDEFIRLREEERKKPLP